MKKTTLLTLLLSLSFTYLSAQIVYTDIPDGQPAGLDFNGDGTYEFDISTQVRLGDYIEYISHGADNNVHALGDANNAWDTPAFVAQGFTIDASNNWIGQGDAYPNGDYANPPGNSSITPGEDQYMAVRFNLTPNLTAGSDVYYGWVRVNIDSQGNVTYKDFAYESTPGKAITAGDKSAAAVKGLNNTDISFFPNPAHDVLYINHKSQILINKAKIMDVSGKLIKKFALTNEKNTIPLNQMKSGVYLINFYNNNTILGTYKLMIK